MSDICFDDVDIIFVCSGIVSMSSKTVKQSLLLYKVEQLLCISLDLRALKLWNNTLKKRLQWFLYGQLIVVSVFFLYK